jgi:hypothetical protein
MKLYAPLLQAAMVLVVLAFFLRVVWLLLEPVLVPLGIVGVAASVVYVLLRRR